MYVKNDTSGVFVDMEGLKGISVFPKSMRVGQKVITLRMKEL